MRTFDSRHYRVLGYQSVLLDGRALDGWLLETLPSERRDFQPMILFAMEAKFVDDGHVYFLRGDGRVEDKSRIEVPLPG